MRIIETRTINTTDVYNACNEHGWYTNGDNESYNNLLMNLCGGSYKGVKATTNRIQKIATDIWVHSDRQKFFDECGYDGLLEYIVYVLINDYCTTRVEIDYGA